MPDLADRLGATLLDASLAATAIAGLVALVMVHSRQPARRRGWARAGLLSTLALLPLSALNPVPRIDLWRPILAILPATLDDPGPRPGDRGGRPKFDGPSGLAPCGEGALPACDRPARAGHGPSWPRRAGRALVLAYGVGTCAGLGLLLLGLFGSTLLARRAQPPSPESLGLLASLPYRGFRGRPRLLVSDRATRPVLLGFARPTILIPPDFDGPDAADRLRLGLLHELAHAEAGDHLFGPIASLAQSLWFFLPPIWWIRERMRLDQEFLADSRAVAHFGASNRYASALVDLAGRGVSVAPGAAPPPSSPPPSPGVASALFQRILMLLKCPFPIEDRPPAWWRWSAAATIAAVTLAASCLTLRGLAGWSDGPGPPVIEPARSFRLPRLDIAPQGDDDPPFDLRLRLPGQFTLSLEVLADPADLPHLEILGHRLGPGAGAVADPSREASRPWHLVEIRRVGAGEDVRVDGLPIPSRVRPHKLALWLTIRPPRGRSTRIRDLDLSW